MTTLLSNVVLCLLFQVLPIIIFFSSVISLCYYIGIMQLVIKKIAWLMQITMKTSGVESLNAAGNIFIGQVHTWSIDGSFFLGIAVSLRES